MNADTLRLALTGHLVAMSLLALLYLRRRPLTWIQFAAWGLVALLVPALGPFLVILSQPSRSIGTRSDKEYTKKSAFTSSPEGSALVRVPPLANAQTSSASVERGKP